MNVIRKDATITNTDEDGPGSFEVVLSTAAKDRDGDELAAEDWKQPLPDHITFDTDHGMSVASTVGSGVPSIEDGKLIVRGTYSSLPRAQDVRTLVKEGHIRTTSVAFMSEKVSKGGRSRTVRELLNGAFVAIPSNREAVVLSAKSGARNSRTDAERIQAIHDHALALGAQPMDDTGAAEGAIGGKAAGFTPLAKGTQVTWHYRSAIGHGTIVGVHKMGTTHADTEYSIEQHDHHVSESGSHESAVVYHFGSALTVGKSYSAELKGKYTAEQLRAMLAKGEAMKGPGGEPSYPIGDKADLANAIHAVGRGNADHDAIRAYIIRRAKDLGASDMIPANWGSDGSMKAYKPGHDPASLAQGVDAALDEALALLVGVDQSTLPEPVAQALGLVNAAAMGIDELLDVMGVDDPDDEDGDVPAPAAAKSAAPAADADVLTLKYRALNALAAYTG